VVRFAKNGLFPAHLLPSGSDTRSLATHSPTQDTAVTTTLFDIC